MAKWMTLNIRDDDNSVISKTLEIKNENIRASEVLAGLEAFIDIIRKEGENTHP